MFNKMIKSNFTQIKAPIIITNLLHKSNSQFTLINMANKTFTLKSNLFRNFDFKQMNQSGRFGKRFYSSSTSINYTMKLLNNTCTEIEIYRLKREKFCIDCQEIRRNSGKLTLNTNFFKITFASSLALFTPIHLLYTISKLWLCCAACIITYKISLNLITNDFEKNITFVSNFKYSQASEKILIKDNELAFSVINITPEVLMQYTYYYMTNRVNDYKIVYHLTSLIKNNKEFFNIHFNAYVRHICSIVDVFKYYPLLCQLFRGNSSVTDRLKLVVILETLQKNCNRDIDYGMKIKNDLTFADYNESYFNMK